ncbi:uncharacterized protein LOC117639745 [Thrips palmi]|uniref:Uncharacterized protein LOC117639745 n=1 Tax=Thrips palmi TaxID=161013 RepID=A0A6P8Y693_THRPL|nr:uncharacterized protein LOC117639745 [Thrips palmi]
MAELLFLSDDTLLAVLAYLPIRELFSLRTVCRRLRDLCVKRDLWRHARVEGKGLVRAALALAPCLGLLDVAVEPLGDIASFVRSTTFPTLQGRNNKGLNTFDDILVRKISLEAVIK